MEQTVNFLFPCLMELAQITPSHSYMIPLEIENK